MNEIPQPRDFPLVPLDQFEVETRELFKGAFSSKFAGGFAHDIIGRTVSRDWLLKGVVLARTFSLVLGAPGCGKSFLQLDYAMTAASAAVRTEAKPEWFGRRMKPCGVVYISAEGQEDFTFRIKSWLADRGLADLRLPFFLIPTPIDMRSDTAQTDLLIGEVKAVSEMCRAEFGVPVEIVVVDTVNRALAGGNENASEVMGAFVSNCGRLKDQCEVAVIGVHHSTKNKDAPVGARGHSSLHGASDCEIVVNGAEGGAPNSWQVTRLKAGPTGARHEFRLKSHVLGKDEDGDDITSCVVKPLGSDPSEQGAEFRDTALEDATRSPHMTRDGRAILGDNLTHVMRALATALDAELGDPPLTTRVPHGRKATTFKSWLDEMVRQMPGDDKESAKFRDRCRKARDAAAVTLRRRDIIGMDGDWVWRTHRRVASVDRAEFSGPTRHFSETGDRNSETEGSSGAEAVTF